MNWEVTHSCGHIETHLIVVQFAYLGETRARQLKRRKCTACYRAGKQAKATDQAEADDAVLAGIDLPALVGSEKQVDWAGKIRRERTLEDTPSVRGMINAVKHLVEIVEDKK